MTSSRSSPPLGRRTRRGIPPLSLSQLPWPKLVPAAIVIAAVVVLTYHNGDIQALHAYAARLDASLAFGLLVILPLLGVPVSVLHVAAGIRFGVQLGLLLVAVSILLQLLASYGLVQAFGRRISHVRWVRGLRARIPAGAHASVSLVTVLLPGAPYAAINYVLPILGVPLRTYLLVAFPLHTLRSTITVTFGDQSDQLTATRLALLLAYASLVLAGSWLAYHRVRAQLEDQPPAEGDQKQPA